MSLTRQSPLRLSTPGTPDAELVAYYDQMRYYYPKAEPETRLWCAQTFAPDWVSFDVGANVGLYATLFSRLSPRGQVFAFEPTETAEMLRTNLTHNACGNVTVLETALGREIGLVEDSIYRIWGEDPERRTYPFSTVDATVEQLGLTRLDCLKIDVDSFDFEVLQGATQTLRRFDPFILVELNHALAKRNQSNMTALSWLMQEGYAGAHVLDTENFVLKRTRITPPSGSRAFALWFPVAAEDNRDEIVSGDLFAAPSTHNDSAFVPSEKPAPAIEGLHPVGLRLRTPPHIWYYALSFNLQNVPLGVAALDLAVEVYYELVRGRVGIGLIGDDGQTFAGRELDAEPGRQKLTLRFQDPANKPMLMFRNCSTSGQPSEILIHGLRMVKRRSDAGAMDRLAQVMETGERMSTDDISAVVDFLGVQEQ